MASDACSSSLINELNEEDELVLEPADLSDVVLSVEGKKFKSHRLILSMWSPVFKLMFSSEFKEKHSNEVPLPDKKANEIRELLLVIYPKSMKPITEENCYFLLRLADEYQMDKVTEKCEDHLLVEMEKYSKLYRWQKRNSENKYKSADVLILSQEYHLERLQKICIGELAKLDLKDFKEYKRYEEISDQNEMATLIRRIKDFEEEKVSIKSNIESVISAIGKHVDGKIGGSRNYRHRVETSTWLSDIKCDTGFSRIESDDKGKYCLCSDLSGVGSVLQDWYYKSFS